MKYQLPTVISLKTYTESSKYKRKTLTSSVDNPDQGAELYEILIRELRRWPSLYTRGCDD